MPPIYLSVGVGVGVVVVESPPGRVVVDGVVVVEDDPPLPMNCFIHRPRSESGEPT